MTAPAKVEAGANTAPASGPETQEVPLAEQAWVKEARRLAKNNAMGLVPVAAMAGTWAAGAAAAATNMPSDLVPLGAGAGVAVGAYGYAHKKTTGYQRVYAGIAAVASEMFQLGIGVFGGTSWAAATMVLVGSALALPHWVRHSTPDPDVTAERAVKVPAALPPVPTEPSDPSQPAELKMAKEEQDKRIELWGKHIAAKGKNLTGSTLGEPSPIEHGWKAEVELPIEHHWHELLTAIKTITSVYGLPDGRVFPRSIPGESVRKARITVLESDPLEKVQRWEGPGLDASGTYPLMTPADGEAMLRYRLWTPGQGANHGLTSGGTRSGKTKTFEVGITECAMSPIVKPMIIDGGGGASLPQWLDRDVEYARTLKDAKELVKYLLNLATKRRPALIEQGGGSIEPSEEHPLIALWIDEAHEFLMADREFVRLCERYAQQLAKYAFGLHLSTQAPSVEQLGGSSVLRGQLKTGTIVALRVTEGSNQTMIEVGDPMPEQLHRLPGYFANEEPTRGLGYVMTADRKVRSRAVYLENSRDYEIVNTPLESALDAVPKPELTGEEASDETSSSSESGGSDAVAHALANGCPNEVGNLMQATGLSMKQVMAALKELDS